MISPMHNSYAEALKALQLGTLALCKITMVNYQCYIVTES